MKVILLKDVSKIGRKNEVREVAQGYASNFLIPNGLAKFAVQSEIKRIEVLRLGEKEKQNMQSALFKKSIKGLKSEKIYIKANSNDKGHLFKGIHKEDLVREIKIQVGLDVLPEYIILEKAIKEIGEHEVKIKGLQSEGSLNVVVEPEKS